MTRRACFVSLIVLLSSVAGRAPAQAPQGAPPQGGAPFQLTPQEQAELDNLLLAWQKQQVNDFTCTFTRWEYDEALGPQPRKFQISEAKGFLRYKAPDKGLFRVEEFKAYDRNKDSYEPVKDAYEQWQCDGKSIFMFDYKNKMLKEHPLPPELQGKEIINGPLPFLFGVDAEKLKQRYWIRITANNPPQICLEAYPRWQRDAANYRKVDLILKGLLPFALQVWDPNGKSRTAYQFDQFNAIQAILQWPLTAPNTPFGWKYELEQLPGNSQPPAQNPGPAQAPGSSLPIR